MYLKHFLSGVSLACLLILPVMAAEPLQPRGEVSVKGGTDRSLLTTEFWAPIAQESDRVLYGDIRLMGDNDENREGNLGIGYRQIHKNAVLGGHAWIDRRRTQHNSTFHQLTFGLERLGHVVDARANVYVPLNSSRTITTPNVGSTTPYLAGSGIFYDTNGSISETPQYGLDGELGYRIPIFQKHADAIRVYGGGYHFFRNNTDNVTGFRIRTEAQINRIVSVGARYQYDEPRGSQGFLEATLKFPFSAKKLYQTDALRSRLDEAPERDVDIVTDTKIDNGLTKPIINTTTGQQQRVIYVDNTNTQTGDGTKENPYSILKNAEANLQANDVLYINHGDGTTAGMNQGIIIDKPNVTLIGSGSAFVYDGGKFTAQNGTNYSGVLLQAASVAPIITNNQAFVDDGTGNVTSITGNGIFATQDNISISGISVSNASAGGIFVLAQKPGTVFNNVMISNVTVTSSQNGRGILVHAYDGAMINNVNVIGNTSNGNLGTGGIGIQIRARLAGSQINNIIIQNNKTNNNSLHGSEVLASNDARIVDTIMQGNTTSGNNGIGVSVLSNLNSKLDIVRITDNISTGNMGASGSGIRASSSNNSVISNAMITNNISTSNIGRGIYILVDNSQLNQLSLIQNTASNNTGSNGFGIDIRTGVNGIITEAYLTDNVTKTNTRSGLALIVAATSAINKADLQKNISTNNTDHGIWLYASAATSMLNNVSLSSNELTANGANGVYLLKTTGAVYNVDMGGGASGSIGRNKVFSNTGTEIRIDNGYALTARNNYWGGGDLTVGERTLNGGSTIDTTGFLVTAP